MFAMLELNPSGIANAFACHCQVSQLLAERMRHITLAPVTAAGSTTLVIGRVC